MWASLSLWPQAVALGLLLLGPACQASVLGAVINIEPLSGPGEPQVRAHYSLVAAMPCLSLLRGVCDEEDCITHVSSTPLRGLLPLPGWCQRQWQKTLPNNHTSILPLWPEVSLTTRAGLSVRKDTGRVNQPPYAALPPPIRVSAPCPRRVFLSVRDVDGDQVRCRYAHPDLGECQNCPQHAFLQLDTDTCSLLYSGGAATGQYSVLIMLEDFPPSLENLVQPGQKALSSVPLYLTITVESGPPRCPILPALTGPSPAEGAVIYILPFQEVDLNFTVQSEAQSPSEVAVVGPPDLQVSALERGEGSQVSINLTWVRSPREWPRLLSICVAANGDSMQSDTRCIWLHQRQMDPLPIGTELRCGGSSMSLVLPVSSLENLHLSDLRLNDPNCPVTHNTTHVNANIPFNACGTKPVHSGSELVYTNTLRTIRPHDIISRLPSLLLPFACRIPSQWASGPRYRVIVPQDDEVFGSVTFWVEVHRPGSGPLAEQTRTPQFRSLVPVRQARDARAAGRVEVLDLQVFSSSSLDRAELMVTSCVASPTQDFIQTQPIMDHGCSSSNSTLEVVTSTPSVRVYRINVETLQIEGNTMFVECTMHLCVTTRASQRCPDACRLAGQNATLVSSLVTRSYSVRSGPVPLADTTGTVTTPLPNAPIGGAAASQTTTSHAPQICSIAAVSSLLPMASLHLLMH